MDPYLELRWRDVHTALIGGARNMLNSRLPDGLAAEAEEQVSVGDCRDVTKEDRSYSPDVRILDSAADSGSQTAMATAVAVADAPIRLIAEVEPVTERYVRIVASDTERLITVIEFLSPSNKLNPGCGPYLQKRHELVAAGVNFVEVDLVREGNWQRLLQPHHCPDKWLTTYRTTVRVPQEPHIVYLYPMSLRRRLPSIVIPLRPDDPEVRLELQELVDEAYVNGRYDRRLDYKRPLDRPLDAETETWADSLLKAAGRR